MIMPLVLQADRLRPEFGYNILMNEMTDANLIKMPITGNTSNSKYNDYECYNVYMCKK